MASTYSTDLKLELITTGEKAGQWGTVTNTNLQILEQSGTGYIEVAVGGANVTLALSDGAISDGKNLYFKPFFMKDIKDSIVMKDKIIAFIL